MSLTRERFRSLTTGNRTVLGSVLVQALSEFEQPGKVYICKVSAGGRDRISAAMLALGRGQESSYRARVVVETACTESGEKLFTDEDIAWLTKLDYDVLEPILDESNRLNKYDDQAVLEKK